MVCEAQISFALQLKAFFGLWSYAIVTPNLLNVYSNSAERNFHFSGRQLSETAIPALLHFVRLAAQSIVCIISECTNHLLFAQQRSDFNPALPLGTSDDGFN